MPPVRRLISRVFLSLWTLHARMRAASSTVRFNQLSHARLAREHLDASISLNFPVLRVLAQAAVHRHVRPCACHVWYAKSLISPRIVGIARRTGIAPSSWKARVAGMLELRESCTCPYVVFSEFEKARMSAEAEDKKKQPRKGWTLCHKTHVESDSVDSVTQGGYVLARKEGT